MASIGEYEEAVKKFVWRRNIHYDLMLLSEVNSKNPFAFINQKSTWTDIAKSLQEGRLNMKVTDRSCRERTMELIKKHRKDELTSIQTSGMSEAEMSELRTMLTSVANLEQQKPNKQLKTLYSRKDKADAEAIRSAALQGLDQSLSHDKTVEKGADWKAKAIQAAALQGLDIDNPLIRERVLEEAEDEQISEQATANQKRKSEAGTSKDNDDDFDFDFETKISKSNSSNPKEDLVTFLEKKSANELIIRRDELRVREMEANNKKKNWKYYASKQMLK